MPQAIVMGATSGIGRRVTEILAEKGWKLTVCGRNETALDELCTKYDNVTKCVIDITEDGAEGKLSDAIDAMEANGSAVDVYFHASGVGNQNKELASDIEERTVMTNTLGWTRMIGVVYRYFAKTGHGHIAVISSIAGTRGLGAAPSYSATKAFQNTYIEALAQQVKMRGIDIHFTDIRPGFVRTPLLGDSPQYPMLMDVEPVAQAIVEAIEKKKEVAVIDWKWRVVTDFWRLIPHWIWRRMKVG